MRHSLSPGIHNAAFAWSNLDYIYLAFEVEPENLKKAVRSLPSLGIVGVNLTIPHKETAMKFLDKISSEARMIGAVNTVKVEHGKLIGFNTDSAGFIRSLKRARVNPEEQKAVIIGAGGAGRAVGFGLAFSGAGEIVISDLKYIRAKKLAEQIKKVTKTRVRAVPSVQDILTCELKDAGILVNASFCGMKKTDIPVVPEIIRPGMIVCDVIYTPSKTRLLSEAEKRHCRIVNGEGMLVFQAALAWEIWTSKKAPVELMFRVLRQALLTKESRGL